MSRFTESVVEDAALGWLEAMGYAVLHGPEIAAGEPGAERRDPGYRDVVLERRLRGALARLNPELSPEALDDAFRKLTRADAPSLLERNRATHRMLVDDVTVEYRRADGSIAGAQARVIDFDAPENNDWLAVNQFTLSEGQHTRRPDVVLFVNGLALGVIEIKNAGRERDHLVRVPAVADLPGADPDALLCQCGARDLRRCAGAHRHVGRGPGGEFLDGGRSLIANDSLRACQWPAWFRF